MPTTLTPTDTHESEVLFSQAMELLSRNHILAASKRFEEALQISPNNALYLSYYGLCVATERSDHASAIKLCERAVNMDPKNPVIRVNLGKVHRLKGDNSRAYESFLDAWKTDKSHPSAAVELSRMGIRRPPVLPFLSRSHWLNRRLGMLRALLERGGK
jgi:thioredoxin-like negative regulator of GroEL